MKKMLYIAVGMILALSLAGCTAQQQGETQEPDSNVDDNIEVNAETIAEYFPTDKMYRLYSGYAEAGFEVNYSGKEENEKMTVFKYSGNMCDERYAGEGADRTFSVTYTISNNSVIESVVNNDPIAESKNNVYSRIKDMVVLSGNIQEGNSWKQEISLDGKEVEAVTTITEVSENGFKTETVAEAEGYKDGKYTEKRAYEKGKGLVSFSNTPLGSEEDDTLIFGYSFAIENKQPVVGND